MRKSLVPIVLLLSLSGCVQTQATMLDASTSARPPVDPDLVRIYRTPASVACAYDEVAIVHAQGSSASTNENQMLTAARRRAGRIGANGVIIDNINEPSAGARVAGAIFGVAPSRRGEMLAIYVHDPCRTPTPTGAD